LEQLIETLNLVNKQSGKFTATICGDALPHHKEYHDSLKEKVRQLGLSDIILFADGVPNDQTPEIYSAHDIFVNLSPSGMFDKTIFEAMSCKTLAMSCNKNLIDKIDLAYLFTEDNTEELANRIIYLLTLSREEREARGEVLRNFTIQNHSLQKLGFRLSEEIK
jgi:glycosyltransferase involved in cell wall biosynthesis